MNSEETGESSKPKNELPDGNLKSPPDTGGPQTYSIPSSNQTIEIINVIKPGTNVNTGVNADNKTTVVTILVVLAAFAVIGWYFIRSLTPDTQSSATQSSEYQDVDAQETNADTDSLSTEITEIFVTEDDISLEPNGTYQLSVAVLPPEANGVQLSYVSSDPKIVTVSSKGMLKVPESHEAGGIQTATITIQAENGTTRTKSITVDFSADGYDAPIENVDDFIPEFTVEPVIRLAGTSKWGQAVEAKVGDQVEIQIMYHNISDFTQKSVMVRNLLPAGLQYIPGSTIVYNTSYPDGYDATSDKIVTTGVNIGTYYTKASAYVRFTAEVIDEASNTGSNTLLNWSQCRVGSVTLQDYTTIMLLDEK